MSPEDPKVEGSNPARATDGTSREIGAAGSFPLRHRSAGGRGAIDELDQVASIPSPSAEDPAFAPDDDEGWRAVRRAHDALAPMFGGTRVSLDDACTSIRGWLASFYSKRVAGTNEDVLKRVE
jgi:hypothetical protein